MRWKSLAFAVVSVLVLAASASAQIEMRYYFVPKAGDGLSPFTAFFPKYFFDPFQNPTGFRDTGHMDYGLENVFLVAANLDATQNTTLTANSDVLAVPNPITNQVSALALSTVQTKLEAGNIPADWVTTSMTYKQVMSRVMRIIQFMQRFHGTFGQLFAGGATLDTRINQLPVAARNALAAAAQSQGADTSSIVGTTLIRQALVIVADQTFLGGIPFGDTTF